MIDSSMEQLNLLQETLVAYIKQSTAVPSLTHHDRFTLLYTIHTVFQSFHKLNQQDDTTNLFSKSIMQQQQQQEKKISELLFHVLADASQIIIQYWSKVPIIEHEQQYDFSFYGDTYEELFPRHMKRLHHNNKSEEEEKDTHLMILAMKLLYDAFTLFEYPFLYDLLLLRFQYSMITQHHQQQQDESHDDQTITLVDILIFILVSQKDSSTSLMQGMIRGNPRIPTTTNPNTTTTTTTGSDVATTTYFYTLTFKTFIHAMHCGEFLQRYCSSSSSSSTAISSSSNHHLPTCEIDSILGRGLGGIISIHMHTTQSLDFLIYTMMNQLSHVLNHGTTTIITMSSDEYHGGYITTTTTNSIWNVFDCYDSSSMTTTAMTTEERNTVPSNAVETLFLKKDDDVDMSMILLWIEFISLALRVGFMDGSTTQPKSISHQSCAATRLASSVSCYIQAVMKPSTNSSCSSANDDSLLESLLQQQYALLPLACINLWILLHWRMNGILMSTDIHNIICSKKFLQRLFDMACSTTVDRPPPPAFRIIKQSIGLLISLCMTQNQTLIEFCSIDTSFRGLIQHLIETTTMANHSECCYSMTIQSHFLLAVHLHDLLGGMCRRHLLLLLQDDSNRIPLFIKSLATFFEEKVSFTTSALAKNLFQMILHEHPSQQFVDDLSRSCWRIVEEVYVFILAVILKKCSTSMSTVLGMKVTCKSIQTFLILDTLNFLCKSPVYCQAILRDMLANEIRNDSSTAASTDAKTSKDSLSNASQINSQNINQEKSKPFQPAKTGVEDMNFNSLLTLLLNETTSTTQSDLQPMIARNKLYIIVDNSSTIIKVANAIVYSLVLGNIYSGSISEVETYDVMTYKVKMKKRLQLVFYSSSSTNNLGIVTVAFKQSLSRELIKKALQLWKIIQSLTVEGDFYLSSFIFSSTLLQEQQSNQCRYQDEKLKFMTKVIDDLQKDLDIAVHALSTRKNEENAILSRSIVMAKAEALEVAELEALGRRMAESKLLQTENKFYESSRLNQQLEDERESLNQEKYTLQSEVSSLSEMIESAKEQNQIMQVKQDELNSTLLANNKLVADLNSKIAELSAVSFELDSDRRSLQLQFEDSRTRTVMLEQEIEEAHFHLVSLAKLYEYQEKILEASKKEYARIKAKYSRKVDTLEDELAQLQKSNVHLQENNKSLERKIFRLQDERSKRIPTGPISYLNSIHDNHTVKPKYR